MALITLVQLTIVALFTPMVASSEVQHIKKTNMVFYMQDWGTGPNPTAISVAGRNRTSSTITSFGTIIAIDDAVTEGLDGKSKEVGRARGIYVTSALDASEVHLLFSVLFTNEKYNESTLEIQGSDRANLKQREVSVVSGTGLFRYAKGYAVLETAYIDLPNLNAVIKFNVTVRHP
ncbi:dirigent protein 23-like [Magnolia sinica]|uniref:dirigent protein 23-like n=1 Tax=Magnolia sinica TaxID=86752 RepID=UPI002659653D|nr:dirigent protein 23-like [Magnolia sinica]